MTKKAHWVQILLFLVFIGGFFLLNLILPDRSFSEQENRYLQRAPRFSFSELFAGRFTQKFEKYTTDQFAGRDGWITLKARAELLEGKKENNGVYLCPTDAQPLNAMLIERFEAPSDGVIAANVAALDQLAENVEAPVYFALIPGAGEVYRDRLPANAPMDSQTDVIEKAYALTSVQTVDMYGALAPHAGEYIFYGTDHHWTSRGAYYGYTALARAMGFEARPQSEFSPVTVSERFYGTTYSSSGFSWVKPDRIERWVPQSAETSVVNYPEGQPVASALYDDSFLEKKDKYASFLGGNTPRVVLDTGKADKPVLLVVRDSYMDSLTPFLLEDFSQIHILDLRYYRQSLKAYVQDNGIDEVLVCYSVANFSSDANLFLLGY